ncbi:hypothetical protein T02_16447 [Trichinella nativa]|uniref:Uncharacterized protein n=1 Tax=Trichinella nativa TaxID=6335 RepID=A0A0V1LSS9_9BILA|nr:hypothetical protein T02_16447 [Trichinella nativa]
MSVLAFINKTPRIRCNFKLRFYLHFIPCDQLDWTDALQRLLLIDSVSSDCTNKFFVHQNDNRV